MPSGDTATFKYELEPERQLAYIEPRLRVLEEARLDLELLVLAPDAPTNSPITQPSAGADGQLSTPEERLARITQQIEDLRARRDALKSN